ncbi:type II toxin-antitoxin system RelE/ParE family toxin [Salimicrobium album]|uniref:ParE-like toxin of type II toxin-antitoxin system n=1 Tax=Salimicrobium album TaxID=50717 RepID=A0A1H3J0Y4_9BACI|nr:type II toxin-antitoxin system RelE/ParE family toxin [Salimicrobium album]SDY33611.1 ParE-like toxin of type II toxin-antitoxin system [Salimicrobium album]
MEKAKLKVQNPAKKFFKKIKNKQLKCKYEDAIETICLDPYQAGDPKTGDLAGVYGYDIRHNKIGYELAYTIEEDNDGNTVVILHAGTREQFYKELKRYLQ